jgi:hypothetical protein
MLQNSESLIKMREGSLATSLQKKMGARLLTIIMKSFFFLQNEDGINDLMSLLLKATISIILITRSAQLSLLNSSVLYWNLHKFSNFLTNRQK